MQQSTAATAANTAGRYDGAMRFLNVLRQVERYPLPDLVMHQARRAETLVRHARTNVPFYADRLGRLFDDDDAVDFGRWRDLPILTNADARAHADAMTAVAVPAHAGHAVKDQTSGTGGEAFHFQRSAMALGVDAGNSLRIYIDHGFDPNARFADIRIDINGRAPYPDGALRPAWSFGLGDGDYAILDISTPIADQVEWLLRVQPKMLFTWGMNARAIALLLEQSGERLPLASLATSAEACTQGVRRDCRRVFGVDPVDIFGAREIGIIAWRCHASEHYHLAAESVFVEVIKDSGEPAAPGETGRVVATPLYNYHMPFLRYATGDYVTLAEGTCPCGRSLPTLSAFRGRDRNRLRKPDGTRGFPTIPERELDDLIGPLRWQIVQSASDCIDVGIDAVSMPQAAERAPQIRDAITSAFGAGYRVGLAEATPPSPGMRRRKRELFRSDLAE